MILIRYREIKMVSDGKKLLKLLLFKLTILSSKDFMKNYNLKNDTMDESEIQRVYSYSVYPKDSKLFSERGFVNMDNGRNSLGLI